MTVPEVVLWSRLQRSQLRGLKFRRQYGVGPYIVDFYCPRCRLAIEIDGDSHFESAEAEDRDRARTAFIEGLGITILRFTNHQVGTELEGVLAVIAEQGEALADEAGAWWSDREREGDRSRTTP